MIVPRKLPRIAETCVTTGTALEARKEFKPRDSALDVAAAMGIEILTEEEYRHLQTPGEIRYQDLELGEDPAEIRKLGGALFCDRRYDHVFTYHNGADSYYGARGFRGSLRVLNFTSPAGDVDREQ